MLLQRLNSEGVIKHLLLLIYLILIIYAMTTNTIVQMTLWIRIHLFLFKIVLVIQWFLLLLLNIWYFTLDGKDLTSMGSFIRQWLHPLLV